MNVSDDGKIQAFRAKLIFVGSATTLRSGFPIPAEAQEYAQTGFGVQQASM